MFLVVGSTAGSLQMLAMVVGISPSVRSMLVE
jgi:hypothetical protein